jgi:hypothetical protein
MRLCGHEMRIQCAKGGVSGSNTGGEVGASGALVYHMSVCWAVCVGAELGMQWLVTRVV